MADEGRRIAAAYGHVAPVSVHILSAGEDALNVVLRGTADVLVACAVSTGGRAVAGMMASPAAFPGPVVELGPRLLESAAVGRFAVAVAVDAFGPRPELTLEQALAAVAGRPPEGLRKVSPARLAELGPARAGLPVDGVRPTPAGVASGRYPLAVPVVALWGGNLPSPAWRILSLLTGRQRREVAGFVRWLQGGAGQEAILGVGDLVTVVAAGDVLLDRGVARKMEVWGPGYPFDQVRDILTGADLAACNLESVPAAGGDPVAGKGIWFRAGPEAVAALGAAGFDLVSVANNHALDYGRGAFVRALEVLDEFGIRYCGGGRDIEEARAPAVLECNGVRIAFLGYSEFADLYWTGERFRFIAGEESAGVAPIRRPEGVPTVEAVERANPHLAEDIAAARAIADVVVVSVHWGVEYSNRADRFQRIAAGLLAGQGADLVLGHHPHAVQGLGSAGGTLVAFSLGNFVFDQTRDITTESMLLRVELSRRGVFAWDVIPVRIVDCRPHLVSGTPDGETISAKLLDLNSLLKTSESR